MQSQANILSFDEARRAAAGAHGAPRRSATGAHAAPAPDVAASRQVARQEAATPRKTERVRVSAEGEGLMDGAGAKAESKPVRPKPSWYTAASDVRTAPADTDDIFLKDEPAARTSRFDDDDSFDANLEEQLEEALEKKKKGPFASLRSKAAKSKHARVKEKAGKAYVKQYEADKAADASQGGPRAAVYKGEMGASHKRSARMQNTAEAAASSSRRTAHDASSTEVKPLAVVRKVLGRTGFVGVALLLTAVFLYGPAQQLYTDIRERDRLAVEYELVTARNEAISEHVEALQTEDGVEDVARAELGWVREGEHAVSVSNLNLDDNSDFQGNIVSEDVPLPDTWYSGFLDPLFGVR